MSVHQRRQRISNSGNQRGQRTELEGNALLSPHFTQYRFSLTTQCSFHFSGTRKNRYVETMPVYPGGTHIPQGSLVPILALMLTNRDLEEVPHQLPEKHRLAPKTFLSDPTAKRTGNRGGRRIFRFVMFPESVFIFKTTCIRVSSELNSHIFSF